MTEQCNNAWLFHHSIPRVTRPCLNQLFKHQTRNSCLTATTAANPQPLLLLLRLSLWWAKIQRPAKYAKPRWQLWRGSSEMGISGSDVHHWSFACSLNVTQGWPASLPSSLNKQVTVAGVRLWPLFGQQASNINHVSLPMDLVHVNTRAENGSKEANKVALEGLCMHWSILCWMDGLVRGSKGGP